MKKIIYYVMIESDENFPYKDIDIDDILASMRLLRTKTKSLLNDSDYLTKQFKNNEEFLLTFRRSLDSLPKSSEILSGPTEDQIIEKTQHLPNLKRPPVYNINHLFRQDDLRKIFITLAKESAYILCTKPHSFKILKYYREKINKYMNKYENAYKVMYKLGFSQDNVKHAMKLNANNYKLALDWLIDNVKQHENLRLSKSPRQSLISNKQTSILSSSFDLASATIVDRLDGLLGIVEFYAEMSEQVSDVNLKEMVKMGYDNEEAREALRTIRNNIGAACEYIAGDVSGSIMELRVGLDLSCPIYDILMKTPDLQQLLSFSESFIYFNKLLEDHIIEWDPEENNGQLLRRVIIKYHEEKHSLVTNQFNSPTKPASSASPLT
ncbi:ubiquitin-associated domain-containing protein 1-like [Chironomus tepperi]|uniref:ubiquitin-associated domain-containing protein 1-like n=1 Tax=Chironomus tepperi TaxID=113505 RepID=UPI00391F20AC